MTTTRGERLRAARRKQFKSARTAALVMGIPVSTYGAHERAELPGGRDFGPEEAKRYARRFGVTPEWLLTGLRPEQMEERVEGELGMSFPPEEFDEPRRPTVPLLGYVSAGADAYYGVDDQGHLDEILLPTNVVGENLTVAVQDDSLGPYFRHWLVISEPRFSVTPDLFGYLCVVVLAGGQEDPLDNGRMVVRELQPGRTEGRYDLLSEFGKNFRDVSIFKVAKVMGLIAPRLGEETDTKSG
jgi:hypothetical protein